MLRKLRKEIIASNKSKKVNVFFLFLFLSFTILILTKLSKDYTNTMAFNINKINVPQEAVILNDSSAKLSVTLKTHGFNWLVYYFSKPKITIDFSKDVTKTKQAFVWNKSKAYVSSTKQFGDHVEVFNITPESLLFKYDVNLVKKVPVILNKDVQFASGFDLSDNYKLQPDSVVVVGPEVIASKIKRIETTNMSLIDVKSNISRNVKLKLPKNNKDLSFSVDEIHVFGSVEKYTEGTLKIPITVTNVPLDMTLNYFPKEVNVTYYVSLKNFNEVTKSDFILECDFSTVDNDQSFLTPKLIKTSSLVKNTKVNLKRIEFIILE